MHWTDRFADLESDLSLQSDALLAQERDQMIEDLAVERAAEVAWADRCLGRPVVMRVDGAGVVRGELAVATADWVLVHHDALTDWVVAVSRVVSIRASGRTPVVARGEVQRRLTWRHAWTALTEDCDEVHVVRIDGSTTYGTPTRVGRDFVEIDTELVPFSAVVALRCPR